MEAYWGGWPDEPMPQLPMSLKPLVTVPTAELMYFLRTRLSTPSRIVSSSSHILLEYDEHQPEEINADHEKDSKREPFSKSCDYDQVKHSSSDNCDSQATTADASMHCDTVEKEQEEQEEQEEKEEKEEEESLLLC